MQEVLSTSPGLLCLSNLDLESPYPHHFLISAFTLHSVIVKIFLIIVLACPQSVNCSYLAYHGFICHHSSYPSWTCLHSSVSQGSLRMHFLGLWRKVQGVVWRFEVWLECRCSGRIGMRVYTVTTRPAIVIDSVLSEIHWYPSTDLCFQATMRALRYAGCRDWDNSWVRCQPVPHRIDLFRHCCTHGHSLPLQSQNSPYSYDSGQAIRSQCPLPFAWVTLPISILLYCQYLTSV